MPAQICIDFNIGINQSIILEGLFMEEKLCMDKQIALIRPNYVSNYISPQLGLGYLSSWLKKHYSSRVLGGGGVIIIDALKENLPNSAILEIMNKRGINIAGITCLSFYYSEVVELSRFLKKHGVKVVIGGVHPTFMPYQTLVDSRADYVVCGEGEIALLKLLESDMDGSENIQGVYSLNNLKDSATFCQKAEIVHNLDDLPYPDWEQMKPGDFPMAPHGVIVNKFPIGAIMSSRGCPHLCKFCSSPNFYQKKVRFRSPENVLDEMLYLKEKFGVKEFQFSDDNLTMYRAHIEKICNLMLEKGINTVWSCPNGIRADAIDDELIKLMHKTGCYYTGLGIESANNHILHNINKKESIETIKNAIDIITRNGVECGGFFIFGLPGETKMTLENTINFALQNNLSRAAFTFLSISPGCEFWDEMEKKVEAPFSNKKFHEADYIPEGLTKDYLCKAVSTAHRRFYFRPKIIFKLIKYFKFSQLKYLFHRFMDYNIFGYKNKG
jgi:radical SAM superfamily enzyme YgiQ (UPF0313 family)